VGTLRDFSPAVSTPKVQLTGVLMVLQLKYPKILPQVFFSLSQTNGLEKLYCSLHSVSSTSITMTSSFRKYKDIILYGRQLGSYRSRSSCSSTVMASWNLRNEEAVRPARINYFAEHSVHINNTWVTHLLFSASWFKTHPKQQQHYGKPISLWECDIFEIPGQYYILPVQAIKCRVLSLEDKLESGETILFICPCIDF
jgi:hypothetical protein